MKRKLSQLIATLACIALGVAISQLTLANTIVYNLDYEFSGGSAPAGTAPWVVVTISDIGSGSVKLTLSNQGLIDNEFTSEVNLNVARDYIGKLAFQQDNDSQLGSFALPTIGQSEDRYKPDGDGRFDIQFAFETAKDKRFGAGESVTYIVTSTDPGLDATDFNLTSTPGGGAGTYHAAAHIQGIGEDSSLSGWIGDSRSPGVVPDGGNTTTLLGCAMLGLGFLARRKT